MAADRRRVVPRTFFLNESHELASAEKEGGGRLPAYAPVQWAAKAKRLSQTLQRVEQLIVASNDPLKDERFFVLANPVPDLEKLSTNKKKAPQGTYKEHTDFGGTHGRVFDRLGMDLLQVTDAGQAIVHAKKATLDQLRDRSASLETLGAREQSRWITIESFETIPLQLRVDSDWLNHLRPNDPSEVIFELQPVLTRLEVERVLRAIADLLLSDEKLTGTGTDFSGRRWLRGMATQRSIRSIAKDFFSVQAIHSPLYSIAAGKTRGRMTSELSGPAVRERPIDATALPCVAILDLGVPTDHNRLRPYKRGQFIPLNAPRQPIGDHGSWVASRVVFGECESHNDLTERIGLCSFYDGMVGDHTVGTRRTDRVWDKFVMEVLNGIAGAAPDVRVFNLSFGNEQTLASFSEVARREHTVNLRDLDNFVFATDSIVVVAAGNSPPGTIPSPNYPDHHEDPRWALGPWACGFNTLVCGAFVSRLSASGLVRNVGWPSPFTRIGPGLCDSPVPSFSAEGGNTDDGFGYAADLGVWCFSRAGFPEDKIGTSFAAPLLAREAALTLHQMQQYCAPGSQPFGVTARAFLTLTASPPPDVDSIKTLVGRTLGVGKARCDRLLIPSTGTAVILWQGFIESSKDIVRVQLPIPLDWLAAAEDPVLRLVVCYDPPVNEASTAGWACRKVRAVLRPGPEAKAQRAPGGGHATYPLIDRGYKLARYKPDGEQPVEGDMWLIEFTYEEIAPYPPGMDFDPRQRVAFAAELKDLGETAADPQVAMQALPSAALMARLSIQAQPIRNPIVLRVR
jgi:hypothetical protein